MRFSLQTLITISVYVAGVYSDFLGQRFPSPVHFTSNDSLVSAGWRNLTATFDGYLKGNVSATAGILSGLKDLTFSLGMFSIHDSTAQSLQYHYTSDKINNGAGTTEVDGDSIYRVASISKLFTVFAAMLAFNDGEWDRPITDFIPRLSKSALGNGGDDNVQKVQWEDVTLRSLAAQISGVPRDSQPWFSDIALAAGVVDLTQLGLPPLDPNDPRASVACLADPELFARDPLAACPPELYFQGAEARPLVLRPWTSPIYSNTGFMLLGIALANITGKPIADVYPDLIFNPLGMTNSRSNAPPLPSNLSNYVIPGDDLTIWGAQGGISISSGGIFSSLNDLSKFSTAIMNSTLFPVAKTRQWMKPVSHTADLTFSVGAPWEIYRYTHANTGAVTDIYTKLGDSGNFTGYVVLIPDYEAGFNIISAGSNAAQKSVLAATIADLVTNTMVPALEAEAAAEFAHNFAGKYQSKDPALNSSIAFTFNDNSTNPDLYITSWISNSMDMIPLLPSTFGSPYVKLQPAIAESGQVAFRAITVLEKPAPGSFLGPFLEMQMVNGDWLTTDVLTYGGVGLSLFVFDVDESGRATSVSPAALRVKLERA